MRDIHNIYVENSSINLTKKMYKDGSIKQIFLDFTKEDCPSFFGDVKYRIYDEFDYSKQQVVGKGPEFYCEWKVADFCTTCSFTDYTFIVDKHHLGDYGRQTDDYSDEWVQFLAQHLQGKERDEYIQGIKKFTIKLSKVIEDQFLSVISDEKEFNI